MEAEEFPIDVCSCPYAYCCSCSASKTYLWWSPIMRKSRRNKNALSVAGGVAILIAAILLPLLLTRDRKSTRLNSSHVSISYAVFCLKKKKKKKMSMQDI